MACLSLVIIGCSTEKNTAKSRWWQAFNTRYNVYYNGNVAYIDGSLEKENGNKDNYTEIIPLYTVANKNSKDLGKANFDKAIEKAEKAIKLHSIKRRPVWNKRRRKTERDIEWLGRKEYNPFLWKAWMLMGRSQFHQGDFDAAASTFNYMARLYETQPAIYGRARAWLAKSYIENDFLYDAEDVIRNMQRDSIHWRAQKEWDYTYADYYIHTKEYDKAIPYLKKVIKHEMRKKQKAREYFLLGQLEAELGHKREAYKAFQKVIRQNPPYELEFNARIAQTEVMAGGQAGKMITKLKRMARSDKNKEYLDQVYYAIGNIYLAQRDTMQAIANYERGNSKATRSGIEKGVLLLKLGDLYWVKEKYNDAQRCYGEAIGLLDKEREDYELLSKRSKVLDELVPFTDAVQLQDSLQTLAKMNEKDRNAAIDRVIEALKKKEKEEKDRLAEENAQQVMQQNGAAGNANRPPTRPTAGTQQQNGAWYFYNPMAVQQGKRQFQRMWGKRENVDNWQRINTTVVAGMDRQDNLADLTDEQRDSIAQAEAIADSLEQVNDSAQNDPHKREYYLAQIPFTEEQVEASNLIIMDGLYNSGVIFKDKLDNLALSEKALTRLVTQYPTFQSMDEAYYHLFLLYSRKGEPQIAENYIARLKAEFPNSQWTQILTDPYFAQNAREGVHIEDSLYAATYNAFKADRFIEVWGNTSLSEKRFPLGANRDKFLFIGGLSKLNSGDGDGCLADMKVLVEKFPESELAEMAGMIVNGVKEGRRLRGGKFDLGNVWARRNVVLSDSDSINARTLSNERNTNFVFMLVYQPDSVNQNKLLFELARYNFTSYWVRDFDINIEEDGGVNRMQISGFRNYDEALQYARQLLKQESVVRQMGKARPVIISEENLPLLGTNFSYDEYSEFYTKHFAPLEISTFHLLTEPAEVVTKPTQESEEPITESEIDNFLNNTFVMPEEPAQPAGTTIPIDGGNEPTPEVTPDNGTIIPIDGSDEPVQTRRKGQTGQTNRTGQNSRTNQTNTPPRTPVTRRQKPVPDIINGAEIILDNVDSIPPSKARPKAATKRTDAKGNTPKTPVGTSGKKTANDANKTKTSKKTEKRPKTFDLEDEYYDLEGF
ncbi:MAG: tetratricopeptide repeat protein [Prevotella sp.]|jgi:tetratricopeptide (TPR) repeat protein